MNNEQVRFASGTNIALALWLIFSPLILGYAGNAVALWDAIDVGVPVLALASYRMRYPAGSAVPSWVNLLLGAWLAASPFALGFTSVAAALWNDVTVGLALVFFTGAGLLLTEHAPRA